MNERTGEGGGRKVSYRCVGKKIEGKIWAAKPQKEAILGHFPDNTGILICAYI